MKEDDIDSMFFATNLNILIPISLRQDGLNCEDLKLI